MNKGSEGVRKTLCVSSQAHGYVTSPIRFASVRGSPVSRLDQGGPTNAALKHFNLPTSTTHGTTRPLSFSAGFCRIFLRPLPLGHKPLPPSCTDCSNLPVSRDVAFHPVSPLLLPPNPSPLGCTFQHPQHDRLWQPTNGRPSRCCHTLRVFECSTRGTNIYRDTSTERLCDAFFFFIASRRWGQSTSYNVALPAYGLKGSTQLSPVHAYECLSRCRFSTPTPRQPIVELFVLTSSRFPLRKSEEKSTPAETRTHKFRLSGRILYTH